MKIEGAAHFLQEDAGEQIAAEVLSSYYAEGAVRVHEPATLPWRGPAPGRPDLPLPPDPMPLVRNGRLRKRWRYVGVYGARGDALRRQGPDRAAAAELLGGLGSQASGGRFAHTRMLPGGGEVEIEGAELRLDAGEVRAELSVRRRRGDRVGLPQSASGGLRVDPQASRGRGRGRRSRPAGAAGEIARAGRGRRRLGRLPPAPHRLALVGRSRRGHRRPRRRLEPGQRHQRPAARLRAGDLGRRRRRASPTRCSFDGLQGVDFADGSRLRFGSESERARDDNLLLVRSRYRHRFGSFEGALPGIELAAGLGVMEEHSAVW